MFLRRQGDDIRRLGPHDRDRAREVCLRDPVAAVLAAVQVETLGLRSAYGSELLGIREGDDDVAALCWVGANVIPVGVTTYQIPTVADHLRRQGRRCSSIVGDAAQVLALWDRLRPAWGEAREVRPRQPSLVIDSAPLVDPDRAVRPAEPHELDLVLPASVAMFTEEVGYDPTRTGGAYSARVGELVRAGRTYIRTEPLEPDWADGPHRVVFKADVGALALGVAQVQGVWVAPDRRSRGLATAGMAAVVQQVRRNFAPMVSLYVNDYNHAAIAAYAKIGMRKVGEYATVLF